MEKTRRTYRTGGKAYIEYGLDFIWRKKLKKHRYNLIEDAIERLASYEDTGCTPEQIIAINEAYTEQAKELAQLEAKMSDIELRHQQDIVLALEGIACLLRPINSLHGLRCFKDIVSDIIKDLKE